MDANGGDSEESEGVPGERESELARKDREWAAKADASPQNPTSTSGATAGPASGGPSTDPQPYRTPKNLRTSNGPRFSGRGLLAVFGILGVLLTIGIMAVLAVKVLDGVSDDDRSADDGTAQDEAGSEGAAGSEDTTGPDDGAAESVVPDGAEIDPGGSTDAARAADCETQRATIETTALAFEIATGAPPSSVDELITAGYLQTPDRPFSQELTPDGNVVGTGDCAPG